MNQHLNEQAANNLSISVTAID